MVASTSHVVPSATVLPKYQIPQTSEVAGPVADLCIEVMYFGILHLSTYFGLHIACNALEDTFHDLSYSQFFDYTAPPPSLDAILCFIPTWQTPIISRPDEHPGNSQVPSTCETGEISVENLTATHPLNPPLGSRALPSNSHASIRSVMTSPIPIPNAPIEETNQSHFTKTNISEVKKVSVTQIRMTRTG